MDVLNITKITLAWELFEAGVPKSHIASRLGMQRETVHLWIKGILEYGLVGFLDRYSKAKKGPRIKRQVDPILKRWIWEIREREMDCCGQKIIYFLEKEHGVSPAISKVYEILAEKYVIKSKWKHNQARGAVPVAVKPREVIQMDSIDFGGIFAFTAVDIFSKEADVILAPELTSQHGVGFLDTCMKRRFNLHSDMIQADGGHEFKDKFKAKVYSYTDRFRVARPYKKNEQSYIESFNRTVRKECLGWSKYKRKDIPELTLVVDEFLNRYHYHRPHIGLGMKPPLERS
ncbi:MAG: integrase core domain-containing protein [Candidatus Daviesbacteria bacterium]|nr:integrase core domain-containing protein [Candidatus Daviesbacteria bacterium]